MSISRETPPYSPAGREMVDVIDELITLRCLQLQDKLVDLERIEVLKRIFTDFLLEIDRRPGIYKHGDHRT